MPAPSQDLLDVVTPLCEAQGLDLEALEVTPAGRRRRVLVVVDKDGGVDLDECAELSRAVSDALDAHDVLGEASYTLEVSSPGTSRPLTLPRHWRRNTGRLVRVVLSDGGEVTGRVLGADGTGADVDVDGSPRRIAYEQVGKAKVQVEFRSATDDGHDDQHGEG